MKPVNVFFNMVGAIAMLIVFQSSYQSIAQDYNFIKVKKARETYENALSDLGRIMREENDIDQCEVQISFSPWEKYSYGSLEGWGSRENISVLISVDFQFDDLYAESKFKYLDNMKTLVEKNLHMIRRSSGYLVDNKYDDLHHYINIDDETQLTLLTKESKYAFESEEGLYLKDGKRVDIKKLSEKKEEHLCYASGCSKEGIQELIGIYGEQEYYCQKHFNSMMVVIEDFINKHQEERLNEESTSR